MNGSGFEDLEPQQHRHLQQQMQPVSRQQLLTNPLAMAHEKPEIVSAGGGDVDCMPFDDEVLMTNCSSRLVHCLTGKDRMEGGMVISNRHSQQVDVASDNRHSSGFGEDPLAAWQVRPKKQESRGLEAFRERRELLTHQEQPDLVGAKLVDELSDKEILQGMDLCRRTTSDLSNKLSGISSRTCRICNKQFASGRALGGHMRVHGPLFTQAASHVSNRISYGMHSSHKEDTDAADGTPRDETLAATPSFVDGLASEWEDDLPLRNAPSSSTQALTSLQDPSDNGHADGAGEEKDLNSIERRICKSGLIQGFGSDEARIEANSAARKSPLYKLRHNPKRSRWFIEQEFPFEAAPKNQPGKLHPPAEFGARVICSECSKSFSSERALFGHMRCHPDRDKRGVLSTQSSSEQSAAGTMARHRTVFLAGKLMESSELQIRFGKADNLHKKGAAEVEVSMGTRKDTSECMSAGIRLMHDADALAEDRGFKGLDNCINPSGMSRDDATPARWRSAGRRSRRKLGVRKTGSMEIRETSSSTPEDEPALTSETISLELGAEEQEIETPDFLILLAEAARKIEEEAELLAISTEKYSHLLKDVKRSKVDHQLDATELPPDDDDGERGYAPPYDDPRALVAGDSNIRYECTTCKKSFNSHQALGGHRASHKKTKGCFARNGSSDASEEHSFDGEQLELIPDGQEKGSVTKKKKKQPLMRPVPAFKGHACSICHRVFLTGQALGGHKRCHWTGEKPPETSASVASTTNKQPSMHSEAQSMVEGGIDLNMPAPMDELDAEEVGFDSTDQMHLIDRETADQEFEVERNAGSLDLVLGTSALAQAVKDLWKGADTRTPSPQRATSEAEVRRRFDGIWGQHWPNSIGATHPQLHQPVYAMESLV